MSGPEFRFEVQELVCAPDASVFRYGGRDYPCGSRWVAPEVAARLLAVSDLRMRAAATAGSVPTDWRGWVSLDYVERIVALRRNRDISAGPDAAAPVAP